VSDDRTGRTRDEVLEDLLAVARRNELGAAERDELERALDADPTLRIARQIGRDFDRIAAVRAGDDELIARAAGRVLAARPPAARRRGSRRLAVAAGLVVALAASGAAAWWAARALPGPRAAAPPARGASPAAGAASAARTERAQSTGATLVAPAEAPRVPAAGARPVEGDRPGAARAAARPIARHAPESRASAEAITPPAPVSVPPPSPPALAPIRETAAELFRRANGARRAGDLGSARALYAEVEGRFPASDEAHVCRVSLGKLLLGAGDADAADREFERYLAGGGGPLVEEALVGRAQSLERLGRAGDERRVWQRLLRDFPSSVYASQASRRIGELTPRRPGPVP